MIQATPGSLGDQRSYFELVREWTSSLLPPQERHYEEPGAPRSHHLRLPSECSRCFRRSGNSACVRSIVSHVAVHLRAPADPEPCRLADVPPAWRLAWNATGDSSPLSVGVGGGHGLRFHDLHRPQLPLVLQASTPDATWATPMCDRSRCTRATWLGSFPSMRHFVPSPGPDVEAEPVSGCAAVVEVKGSNPRPQHCERCALPTELHARGGAPG